ncbi:MAG: YbjQ family protein [Gammaproteobacteria bacterium]|nr:YbjQ family protein [Gammaproteobacteria bacterium]
MDVLIQLGVFLVLLALGYFFGRSAESRHYRSIREREDELRRIVVISQRLPPPSLLRHDAALVCGNVVVSVDYFKTVAAALRGLIGGNLTAYESLLDRARREAILRLQSAAAELGAEVVINLKFETSRVSGTAGRGLGSVEVLAYGTALTPRR